jgi:oligoendopeptidase F
MSDRAAHAAYATMKRADIPEAFTWNIESVFPTWEDWEAEVEAAGASLQDVKAFEGSLSQSADRLAAYFEAMSEAVRRAYICYMAAAVQQEIDSTDPSISARTGKGQGLFGMTLGAIAFGDPEILSIGREILDGWTASNERLAAYAHYIDDLYRKQEHVRSGEVEEILGMLADPTAGIMQLNSILTNADLTFRPATNSAGEELPVGQGSIESYLGSPDRDLRRTAWESYADGYLAMKNTLTANLILSYKMDVFGSRARHYPSSVEASLFENAIPRAVYDNLVATCVKHLPTWHRYWAIRRKALGVKKLNPYDIWAPISKNPPDVPFEQSIDWLAEALAPLGSDYTETFRQGCLHERWVDRYPSIGKTSGAFSTGAPGTSPFIVMNYNHDFGSMSTLSHEIGHSMHSYLTWQNQPMIYSNYSLFVAEVASNFNQAMLRGYLFKRNDDPQFQIALIEEAMDNFHRYFFIMPMLARFELEMHERIEKGQGAGAEDLIKLMADLFTEGYGGEMEVDRERVGITWAQFGHLYAAYYVYQYATGISAAHYLAGRIQAGEPGAAEAYLEFLKAGASLYPLDALKVAGVDMTSPEPIEAAFKVLEGHINRLEALVG